MGNRIKTNKKKLEEQLDEQWQYNQSVAAEEMDNPKPPDFTTTDKKKVEETIGK